MPEMDGLECPDELMQIVPRARVLMVSALPDHATALSALKKGTRLFAPALHRGRIADGAARGASMSTLTAADLQESTDAAQS
jgi:DNA-binding NarL/FixJ family response regulator